MELMTSPCTSPPLATIEDGQLIAAVAQGDKDALTEIVARHLNAVIHFALRFVGHRAEAEDVAQETFIRVWKNAANWQHQGFSFRSWLFRIAYNLCIDELRKRKSVTDVGNVDLTAPGDLPDDGLYRIQQQQQVNFILNELPERQRTAIALCVYQGLSNRDAAQVMEISIEALESLLSRARRTLRNKMTENLS